MADTLIPAGARIADVPRFDRSKHIKFRCPACPGSVWVSKEPALSSWFPASADTVDCPRTCTTALADYIVVEDYLIRDGARLA